MLKTALANPRVRNRSSEKGVTTVEYAIMLILIAVAVSSFGIGLAGGVNGVFSKMLSVLATSTQEPA